MSIQNLIKNIGFVLQHTHKNIPNIQEIYFYENYQLIIEYHIEEGNEDFYLYSLLTFIDKSHFRAIDVFGKRVDGLEHIFHQKNKVLAEEVMSKEFEHVLRKKKIEKLLKD